jgi:hypothetical protein
MICDYFNVPSEIADSVEKYALSEDVRWRLQFQTVSDTSSEYIRNKYKLQTSIAGYKIVEKFWFHQILLRHKSDKHPDVFEEDALNIIKPLQDYIAIQVIQKPVQVARVVLNLSCYYNSNAVTMPHCDAYDDSSISCLYYVNDSSGDTFFFNEDTTIERKVSPKKGTGITFESNTLHAGSYPKEKVKPRVVINFLFKYV